MILKSPKLSIYLLLYNAIEIGGVFDHGIFTF